jgi:hypothetical protein
MVESLAEPQTKAVSDAGRREGASIPWLLVSESGSEPASSPAAALVADQNSVDHSGALMRFVRRARRRRGGLLGQASDGLVCLQVGAEQVGSKPSATPTIAGRAAASSAGRGG